MRCSRVISCGKNLPRFAMKSENRPSSRSYFFSTSASRPCERLLDTKSVTACWSAQLQQYEEQAAVAAVYSRDYDGSPIFTGASVTPESYIKYTS